MAQPQHMTALKRANENRIAQAELKRAIKGREVLLAEVLLGEAPDYLRNLPAEKLAASVLRLTRRQWHRWLHAVHAGLGSTIGSLSERQRRLIGEKAAEWEMAALERAEARGEV